MRFSKVIGLLSVAMFLIAVVLPGHAGHLSVFPHSSGHVPAAALDHSLTSLQEQAGDEHRSGKDECDHAYEMACGLGHCWYPVPETGLTEAVSKDSHHNLDFALANLRDRRVDLPPPRSS
jgi:hypothetical protein